MVIYAGGNNFSVGANLYQMKKAHEDGKVVSEVGEAVEQLHHVFARLKHSLKPVVTAVQGRIRRWLRTRTTFTNCCSGK